MPIIKWKHILMRICAHKFVHKYISMYGYLCIYCIYNYEINLSIYTYTNLYKHTYIMTAYMHQIVHTYECMNVFTLTCTCAYLHACKCAFKRSNDCEFIAKPV